MAKLTEAQLGLLKSIAECKMWDGTPIQTCRPVGDYWYDARPDNAKIDRLIARGLLAEETRGFITITEAGRLALQEQKP